MKKTQFIVIIAISLFITGFFFITHQRYTKMLRTLTMIKSQQVNMFIVYPRVSFPVKESLTFSSPDFIIRDFLASLTDLHSYSPSHEMASEEHIWFMEIVTKSDILQISFDIPHGKGNIVVGTFGHFGTVMTSYYGSFQSRQLYHWYQKYSHRWLEPEGAQPSPMPQPDPPGGE